MTTFSALPKRLVTLTADIREQQQLVKNLHKAENKTYKTYVRARANLMSKKHHDVQNKKTKKWYNLWVNSVAELQALVDQIKRQEATLFELKERRADQVAQDRERFEHELFQQ